MAAAMFRRARVREHRPDCERPWRPRPTLLGAGGTFRLRFCSGRGPSVRLARAGFCRPGAQLLPPEVLALVCPLRRRLQDNVFRRAVPPPAFIDVHTDSRIFFSPMVLIQWHYYCRPLFLFTAQFAKIIPYHTFLFGEKYAKIPRIGPLYYWQCNCLL